MSIALCFSPLGNAQQTAEEKPVVSKAFLEYLAELVEVNGKLIHPTQLEEVQEQQKLPNENDAKDTKQQANKEDDNE